MSDELPQRIPGALVRAPHWLRLDLSSKDERQLMGRYEKFRFRKPSADAALRAPELLSIKRRHHSARNNQKRAPLSLQAEALAFQVLRQWCGKSLRPTSSLEMPGVKG